ncbi:nucleotidyltransferase family protein [bacterium]|nr:nucleotidyltransferase family protein [bacterium]
MKDYIESSIECARKILALIWDCSDSDQLLSKGCYRIADQNDLLLALGEKINDTKQIPQPYRTMYLQKQDLKYKTYQIFEKFLQQCQFSGYSVFTIKSFLPYPYIDNNIDFVVVHPVSHLAYEEILESMGYVRHRSLADIREPNKRMYVHYNERSNYPKLHLHKALSWNGVNYFKINQVWERHKQIKVNGLSIPIPSPEDEILIMAAHAIFENKYITLGELIHLFYLGKTSINWDYIKKTATNNSWHNALNLFLSTISRMGENIGYEVDINYMDIGFPKIAKLSFPYVLPLNRTLPATLSKLVTDIRHFRMDEVPRELFSYLIVDIIWMYWKANKKSKAGV